MIVPLLLVILSAGGLVAALILPSLSDPVLLLAVPCGLASLILLWHAYRNRQKNRPTYIVLDGSNIMHWKDGKPQVETVRGVVAYLKAQGFSPGVVFDANAGHLLFGKYLHHGAMGRQIGLAEDRVMVVNKGTPADPTILAAARDLGARIVTNDRYADWSATHPEVRETGHLVRGGYREGRLWLDLGAST